MDIFDHILSSRNLWNLQKTFFQYQWKIYKKEKLNKILSENTGQNLKKVEQDTERDHFLDANEALDYGLIDKIITQKKES